MRPVSQASLLLVSALVFACDSEPSRDPQTGTLALSLVSHTAEHTYRLRQATFEVEEADGTDVASLDSEADLDATELEQSLDPGSYQVTLLDSWFLERIDDIDAPVQVNATLQSPPEGIADFTIASGASTSVPYTFATDGTPVVFGPGTLTIPIIVLETDGGSPEPTALDLTVDPPAIDTELGTTHAIGITLTASSGFSGPVALSGTIVDESNHPLTGWSLTFAQGSVTLPADGVATATATLAIPTRNVGLAAFAHITTTSSAAAGVHTASVPISVLNRYTIGVSTSADQCVYPAPATTALTIGTTLAWRNNGTLPISIHVNGNSNGCAHQPVGPGTPPGDAYLCTLSGDPGPSFGWYCHSPGPEVPGLLIQPVSP